MPGHVPSTTHVSRGEKYRYFPGGLTKYGNDPTVNERRSHPLRYLESPRGQPIRTRAEEELPGVIGGDAASPEKQAVHGERDSRVGEVKPTIKARTSSETRLSYFIQVSILNSAKIVLVRVNIVFKHSIYYS